ncbi:MAG TPA: OmpH family outer membrane protein [Chitinophagaceae bacterium]
MKNGLLIWNILLTLIVGYLLIVQFSGKKTVKVASERVSASDSTMSGKGFTIAFFEMDSVDANFKLVRDLKAELARKEDAIKNELETLGRNFQQRRNYFQTKLEGGTMTQAEIDEARMELQNMDAQYTNRKEKLNQDYLEFANRGQNDLKRKIEEFVKEYNANRRYSFIIAEEPGLFYYKDSIYNITSDVINGLNDKYKSSKKD